MRKAYKFLFWERGGGILLISSDFFQYHKILHEAAANNVPNDRPDGAGCIKHSELVSWLSCDYDLVTSEEIREVILKVLDLPDYSSM
ncbi:MAG: hypothetical protein UX75_C0009G0010 [Candidatus Moranbacteria bacterium GW2011_GWE2_47_10]|nr:MAG: hypothetical protein UX75_C0009G0010 [Candidatus Moranbacteria bacterium GW2011_GWE2_47_10]